MKTIIIKISFYLALAAAMAGMLYTIDYLSGENQRLKNNYNAAVEKTVKVSDSLSRVRVQLLKKNEFLESKDSTILAQGKEISRLGIKVKNLQSATTVEISTDIDTVVVTSRVKMPGDTVYTEIDSLTIGKLQIKRTKLDGDSLAKYRVIYNPTLRIYVYRAKDGKWRFKNLFVQRRKILMADIVSDDKFINIKNAVVVEIKH